MLPQDPYILLSYVNTKLRDEYSNLTELCAALGADEGEVTAALSGACYAYDRPTNQFKPA